MATLKQAGLVQGLKVNASLAGLIADTGLHSVIDHFVRLLDFSPSELQRSAVEADGHLVPRLRQVRSAMAFLSSSGRFERIFSGTTFSMKPSSVLAML